MKLVSTITEKSNCNIWLVTKGATTYSYFHQLKLKWYFVGKEHTKRYGSLLGCTHENRQKWLIIQITNIYIYIYIYNNKTVKSGFILI